MGIFKIIDNKLKEVQTEYADFLQGKKDDILAGCTFQLYGLFTLFKDFERDDIEEGIVDSSYRGEKHDYGIDALYISANKELVTSIDQLDDYNPDTKFLIHILQFKKGRGVEQGDLLKFKEGVKEVFINETFDESQNEYFYSYCLNFNEIKGALFNKFPIDQIKVKCYIVFGGIETNITGNALLSKQINDTKKMLSEEGYTHNDYEIIGAQKLIDFSKKGDEIVEIVNYEKTLKYITEVEGGKKLNGYISIIKGDVIAGLVKDYQTALFEANIRDYYRKSDLNSKILATSVDEKESKYFWSFNNGLTITCRKVEELPNDKYRLYGIQIVNGCQTSNALYKAASNKERYDVLTSKFKANVMTNREKKELDIINEQFLQSKTAVLTKIIETDDPDLIYRITETTNSQTPIKTFSLKANDDVQFFIEEYLKPFGIYYERRINYWKNQGKRNTVSIQKLFQLYTSQILFKPSQVKTRPKSMFESLYDNVFPSPEIMQMDYALYLIPIKVDFAISKKIRQIQRNKEIGDAYRLTLLSYGKLHLGCFLLHSILGKEYDVKHVVKKSQKILKVLNTDAELNVHFEKALDSFRSVVQSMAGKRKESIPSAVRKTELDEKIVRFVKK